MFSTTIGRTELFLQLAQFGERALKRGDHLRLWAARPALSIRVHQVERRAEKRGDLEMASVQFDGSEPPGLAGAPQIDTDERPVHAEGHAKGRHSSGIVQIEERVPSVGRDLDRRGQFAGRQQDGCEREAGKGAC